jgi:hypothetical protein
MDARSQFLLERADVIVNPTIHLGDARGKELRIESVNWYPLIGTLHRGQDDVFRFQPSDDDTYS